MVAKIAVERCEHLGGILERKRQSRHLGHRHERPENVAGHVQLKLVLLQHREHGIVGAELAFRVKVDLHPSAGLGADLVGHFLQPNVIRAVERLTHAEPVANVGRSRAGAGKERSRGRANQETAAGELVRDDRPFAHGVSPQFTWSIEMYNQSGRHPMALPYQARSRHKGPYQTRSRRSWALMGTQAAGGGADKPSFRASEPLNVPGIGCDLAPASTRQSTPA